MLRSSRLFLSLALATTFVAFANAQEEKKGRGRGGPGGRGAMMFGAGGDVLGLLIRPEVAKHLKMTEDEQAFARMLSEEIREQDRKFFEESRDIPPEERGERFRKWREDREAKLEKQVTEIIGPDRMKRLKQVRMQITGTILLTFDQNIAKEVGLTEEQRNEIREVMRSGGEQMREIFASAREDREAMAKAMQEFRAKQDEKVLAVLNEKQRAKWKEMLGEPIDFKIEFGAPQFRRGEGGPPGGGDRPRRRRDRDEKATPKKDGGANIS